MSPLTATAALALGVVLSAGALILAAGPALAFHKGVVHGAGAGDPIEIQTLDSLNCLGGDIARVNPVSLEWECLNPLMTKFALGIANAVFVTNNIFDGDLVSAAEARGFPPGGTGLEAGDFLCNVHAASGGLPGDDYAAWLSDAGTDAKDRLTPGSGPFLKINGELVATDIDDLIKGTIRSPIDLDQSGGAAPVSVWTGTREFGTETPTFTCDDWESNDGVTFSGQDGSSSATDALWSNRGAIDCDIALSALYCFQR